MNLETILDRRSTRCFIALSWLAALLPAPGELFAQTVPSTPQTTPTELVDAMNGVFGKQTYGRAIHAMGIVLEGSFTPNPAAASLTKAAHLRGATPVPVLVRFSSFAGIPSISDTDPLASPHGIAIKFRLKDGTETDIVGHSFNGFPAATSGEFRQLLVALGQSGPGTAQPTPADVFLGTHPVAKKFLTTQDLPPVSFATVGYYGVNSFRFTNSKGRSHFVRYQMVPAAGVSLLSSEQASHVSKSYLEEEIAHRLAGGKPVRFTLQVQLAQAGDAIEDPSVAWSDTHAVVKLGEIVVTRVVPDSDAAERSLMFTPTRLVPGIEPADPMIGDRGASYVISYGRRHAQP